MSAMESDTLKVFLLFSCLPARLADAGNHAFTGELAEADTTHLEITHESTGSSADFAAIIFSRRKLWCPLLFDNQ